MKTHCSLRFTAAAVNSGMQNQQTRDLSSARKTSNQDNGRDRNHLRYLSPGMQN